VDDGVGADLARSTIALQPITGQGQTVTGTARQNGVDQLEFTSGALPSEGLYRITVTAAGLDVNGLGIQPKSTLGATFLYEKTPPTVTVTNAGGTGVFESKPAHLQGTATDVASGGQTPIPASGVASVEIGGVGPDGEELAWESTKDESTEQQKPWSAWSAEFLPSRSGKYRVSVRVTDKAGNTNIVDVGTLEFTTALAFKGPVYVWPSPLSRNRGDVAHFSFQTNQADKADVTVRIYTASGALLAERTLSASKERTANSQSVTWDLRNAAGADVASGIYVWRLEIDDGISTASKIGRLLVVK
jgi:hypothetical protein